MGHPNFENLVKVVEKLRHRTNGCPWDIKQTHQSLLKFLIEESYEFLHAAELDNREKMEEEIGDVLLQVLLHCVMAAETNSFSLESVSQKLKEKLIRRHPHVFDKINKKIDSDQVLVNWNIIKEGETSDSDQKQLIDDTYLHFPALYAAGKIGKKTNQIGFDWGHPSEVVGVVESEWQEFKAEVNKGLDANNEEKIKEEIGDLLFSMAQLCRHLKFDPEETLRSANIKFLRRFNKMKELIDLAGRKLGDMDQKEMDIYWDKTKEMEKNNA